MSEPGDCDQECTGVAETIRSLSVDEVHTPIEEPRASELGRALEDVQAVVAAWREYSSSPTPSKSGD